VRRPVAVAGFAEIIERRSERDETELLVDVIGAALERAGLGRREIGFVVSGSCDFVVGRPFSFVTALDAVGAWPPIEESHVEMDGAWALYEAWVRLQAGDIDSALVYAFGRASLGPVRDVLALQLDPYHVAPLRPDAIALAALQARALLDSGRASERDLAVVATRARGGDPDALIAEPYLTAPLRRHDCPPISDAAAAVVLVAGEAARVARRRAWIRGIDHRIEPQALGGRDLTRSASAELAGRRAGARDVDVALLHAPFTPQELILRAALGLADSEPVATSPLMVAGLARIGAAAERVMAGGARRALAHATSGPCLQQNLVCVLEAG
jgi:acetyl-CoA acetyltransferase